MTYCSVDDVKLLTGVKPQNFRLEKDDATGLNTILTEWISQCKGLIDSHCNTTFDNVPAAVKNVCMRMTANMVAQAQARKDTPLVKVNDWRVEYVKDEIFTDSLKSDLKPFKKDKSYKSDLIEFEAITGEDPTTEDP